LARDQKGDRLERIIGQRLAASRGAGDAQCPDASIIAAYRERLLPRDERAECERHFAQCARCGSALAALARIDDAIQSGGAASAHTAGGDSRAWWRLRGPLPLAAFGAAAAILIVVAIRTFTAPRGPIGGEARSELQAKSLAANAAPTAAAKPAGAGSLGESNSLLAMNQPARAKPASPPLQKSFAAGVPQPPSEAASMARERSSSRDELKAEKSRALELDKQTAEVAALPAASREAPALAPEASSSATAANSSATFAAPVTPATANGASAGAIAAAPAVAASSTAAPSSAAAPANATGAAAAGDRSAASGAASSTLSDMAAAVVGPMPGANAIVVEPPDHTAVWMVGAHGAISRYSAATGWVPQTSGVTADLSGGSAPSAATCWVVGRAGTILRTVDGEHWMTVVAPVSEDLTGVIARSAFEATISAAGGRRFATSDGGATWRPL
jgi:hypothetical protein